MLKLQKISKAYRKGRHNLFYAAKDITFEIAERQCIGLIGDSGSGKSTIANKAKYTTKTNWSITL